MVRATDTATSANMGSGYDSIGIALELYNIIEMEECDHIDISDKSGQFNSLRIRRNLILPMREKRCMMNVATT